MKAYHDIHVLNFLSTSCNDNGATVARYMAAARAEGLTLLGFANRLWDENVPLPPPDDKKKRKEGLTYGLQIRNQIPKDTEGLRILVGAEAEYCTKHNLIGMSAEGAKKLDYVLIPHSAVHRRGRIIDEPEDVTRARKRLEAILLERIPALTPDRARALSKRPSEQEMEPFMDGDRVDRITLFSDFMVSAFRGLLTSEQLLAYDPETPVVIGKPFLPVGEAGREEMMARISDETLGELFTAAASRGFGLEIGPHTDTAEDLRIFGIARECGCRFALGSGLKSRAEFGLIRKTEALTDRLGLTEDDLMDFVR